MRALGYAKGNKAEAMDLAQTAMANAIDPSRVAWDPEVSSAAEFLGCVLFGCASDRRRSSYDAKRAPLDEGAPPSVQAPSTHPEHMLMRSKADKRADEVMEGLGAKLDGHPIPLQVWRLTREGVRTSRELCARIGCTPAQLKAAREMLRVKGVLVVSERPSAPDHDDEIQATAKRRPS